MVFKGHYFFILYFFLVLDKVSGQAVVADFSFPSNICAGEPFTVTNETSGGSTFHWKFCAKNANRAPDAQNIGNPGGALDEPTYMDIVFANNNYYGFVTNFGSGNLVRLDFGTSLLNNPTVVNLGNINGVLPNGGNAGIQVVQNDGEWYAIIVSGYPPGGVAPRISKVEFGTSITNPSPTGVNWGSSPSMYDPKDLILVKEGTEWVGLTVNAEMNTITRFIFGASFDNPPTITNMGNLGFLGEPSGLFVMRENGDIIVFITNSGDEDRIHGQFDITRLNFGTSLKNDDPNAVNIGNVGNMLQHPRDIVFAPFCEEMTGFVLNAHPFYNSILKLDFHGDINSFPLANDLGNFGAFNYPHSITSLITEGDKFIAFVVNKDNSTISRIVFSDCNNSSIATSDAENPPPVSYNQPGVYNIQLTVNQGQASEVTICKEVVVSSCSDSLVITNDTTICAGSSISILTHPALSYQWTPAIDLDDASSPSPVVMPTESMKYYVDGVMQGNNLIENGDFSGGNNGFTSDYVYTATNLAESEYFVGNDPRAWNPALNACADHTTGTGNMLLVNGSPTPGLVVWSQTVEVKPNAVYSFSAWLQATWPPNPARIILLANGTPLGTASTAFSPPCTWSNITQTWNSQANTTVTLTIINDNTEIIGNDFALDDITFSQVIQVRDSISITVIDPTIDATDDTTVCAGHPVQLDVSGLPPTFEWSPAASLSDANIRNPIATPQVSTRYFVTGTAEAGCSATDSVMVTVVASPVVDVSGDTTICQGGAIQLEATGGGSYAWSPAAALNNHSIANPVTHTLANDVTYRVIVTGNNGCTTEDSVRVNVRTRPQFAASGATTACAGKPVTLQASGGDMYQWSPASAFADPSLPVVTFSPSTSGMYSVAISESVCHFDTTINLNVEVSQGPSVTVSKSNDINCSTPSAVLEASGAQTYLWSPAPGINDAASVRVIASADATTVYTVTGTDEFGCTMQASVTVNVDKSGMPRFVLANAFSPNNDGRNDCFGIQRWGNATVQQFSVYNRWGALVFQTTDASRCWDGTFKGTLQQSGAYVYIIRAQTICGEITRKGVVMLIR